jgi:hypothetical protein
MPKPGLLINASKREPLSCAARRIGPSFHRAQEPARTGQPHAVKDAQGRWWSSREAADGFNKSRAAPQVKSWSRRAAKGLELTAELPEIAKNRQVTERTRSRPS